MDVVTRWYVLGSVAHHNPLLHVKPRHIVVDRQTWHGDDGCHHRGGAHRVVGWRHQRCYGDGGSFGLSVFGRWREKS